MPCSPYACPQPPLPFSLSFAASAPRPALLPQESAAVRVTRALGEYTQLASAAWLAEAPARVRAGQLWHEPAADAFFDDQEHFRASAAVCTFGCAACAAGAATPPRLDSLAALKVRALLDEASPALAAPS